MDKVLLLLESLYNRIRIKIDIQRATLVCLKLDHPTIPEICELYNVHAQLEQAIDDLYFTSKSIQPLEIDSPCSFQLNSKTTSMTSLFDTDYNTAFLNREYAQIKEQWLQEQARSQDLERQLVNKKDEWQDELNRLQASDRQLKMECADLVQRNSQLETKIKEMTSCEMDEFIRELESKNEKEKTIQRLQTTLKRTHQVYMTREADFLFKLASSEKEMQKTLKEYDRLTRNITDFNSERRRLEEAMDDLRKERDDLEQKWLNQKIGGINDEEQMDILRKDFRQLQQKYYLDMLQETATRRQLEKELRDVKAEVEIKRWERVHAAVQTHFDPQLIVNY